MTTHSLAENLLLSASLSTTSPKRRTQRHVTAADWLQETTEKDTKKKKKIHPLGA